MLSRSDADLTAGSGIAPAGVPLEPLAELVEAFGPVSYTHLDVYKRQDVFRERVKSVITHKFAAEDWEEAFATARAGKCGKVILDWS